MSKTKYVVILGIDGSGKSTVTAALPALASAEQRALVGSSGEAFQVTAPDEDLLVSGFYPDGLIASARLSMWFKRLAKRFADNRKLYPLFKLPQMIFQDHATKRLARKYAASIFFIDGNTLLSATGRAANYLRAASVRSAVPKAAPNASDLAAVYRFIVEGIPVPAENQQRLPSLKRGRIIYRMLRALGIQGVWMPDHVIFMDVSPELALSRITRRPKVDLHENRADLEQAREMYLKTIDAFQQYRTAESAHVIAADQLSPGEMARKILKIASPSITGNDAEGQIDRTLGTSTEELSQGKAWEKILSYRYIVRYLIARFFDHAWREPIFVFSKVGKLFLKEGYSAAVMRAIYDQDQTNHGVLDRIFMEYPLHRAVYDRLQILVSRIQPILIEMLTERGKITIFTAPSGYAYDLFVPLESIARNESNQMNQVRIVAADLDPHGYLSDSLPLRAKQIGAELQFIRGNLSDSKTRQQGEESAPFDLALFVGLSAWLPKTSMLDHFHWLRRNLRSDGVFVTDSFTPEAYSLSGKFAGYKANYYQPSIFQVLMDACGFDGMNARIESGRDKINHVYVVRPK